MNRRSLNTRLAAATLLTIGALGAGALAAPPNEVVEHFTATSALMTSSARLTLRPVDIVISRWSSYTDHLDLAAALPAQGPVAFMRLLCDYRSAGTISVLGGPQLAIRYAWFVEERNGNRRIYLATDEPIVLAGDWLRRSADEEPLTFVELRLNRHGDGEGKLSDAASLSVDESRDVIELRDYDRRLRYLLEVHNEQFLEEQL